MTYLLCGLELQRGCVLTVERVSQMYMCVYEKAERCVRSACQVINNADGAAIYLPTYLSIHTHSSIHPPTPPNTYTHTRPYRSIRARSAVSLRPSCSLAAFSSSAATSVLSLQISGEWVCEMER